MDEQTVRAKAKEKRKSSKDQQRDPPAERPAQRFKPILCACRCAHAEELVDLFPEGQDPGEAWVRCRCNLCGPVENSTARRCTRRLHPIRVVFLRILWGLRVPGPHAVDCTAFEKNLRSFLVHHVQPLLEQGEYAVYMMADVKLAPGLEEGVKKLMQVCECSRG